MPLSVGRRNDATASIEGARNSSARSTLDHWKRVAILSPLHWSPASSKLSTSSDGKKGTIEGPLRSVADNEIHHADTVTSFTFTVGFTNSGAVAKAMASSPAAVRL